MGALGRCTNYGSDGKASINAQVALRTQLNHSQAVTEVHCCIAGKHNPTPPLRPLHACGSQHCTGIYAAAGLEHYTVCTLQPCAHQLSDSTKLPEQLLIVCCIVLAAIHSHPHVGAAGCVHAVQIVPPACVLLNSAALVEHLQQCVCTAVVCVLVLCKAAAETMATARMHQSLQ